MKNKRINSLYFMLLGFILSSCNSGKGCGITPEPTPTNSPTPIPTETSSPLPTPTLSPTPTPIPISCSWESIGNGSEFFNNLYNSPSGTRSPLLISADKQTLYVGGESSDLSLVVAKIDINNGTSWQAVADSSAVIASFDSLSSLASSTDGHIIYAAGSKNFSGEDQPLVLTSTDNGNWVPLANIMTDLSLSVVPNYRVTSIAIDGTTVYAAISQDNQSSFVIKSDSGGAWSYVSDAISVFQNKVIYSISIANNTLYVGGVDSLLNSAIVYSSSNGSNWTDISPVYATSAIYSIYATNFGLYGGGYSASGGLVAFAQLTNPSVWSDISNNSFLTGDIRSVAYAVNKVYVSGTFESSIKYAESSDSTNWTAIPDVNNTLENKVSNIVVTADGTIYADGEFSDKVAKYICR